MSYDVNPCYGRKGLRWQCELWIMRPQGDDPCAVQPMFISGGPTFFRKRNAERWVKVVGVGLRALTK